jgi:hypothetical protein
VALGLSIGGQIDINPNGILPLFALLDLQLQFVEGGLGLGLGEMILGLSLLPHKFYFTNGRQMALPSKNSNTISISRTSLSVLP